jgi:hypothetical protein
VQKEKRKEKEKNLKIIHAYEEKQRKAREAIAKREAEKLRKRRLSKAERDREASEKRRIKFLNKQQKEADELRRYGEALQACGGEERLQMMGAVESHESSSRRRKLLSLLCVQSFLYNLCEFLRFDSDENAICSQLII